MEFLGSFLSPSNSIGLDQDKLVKYFYFRPANYGEWNTDTETPDTETPESQEPTEVSEESSDSSDYEDILSIKENENFPKRYDELEEDSRYIVDTIEVTKKIPDDHAAVRYVSYVVAATYDLKENVEKREKSTEEEPVTPGSSSSSSAGLDMNDKEITSETKPWELRATWNFQPVEQVVPFISAYDKTTLKKTIPVRNSAGSRLLAEVKKYTMEITYTKSFEKSQASFENITQPIVNKSNFDLTFDNRGSYPPYTLLMLPPMWSTQWIQLDVLDNDNKPTGEKEWHRYYTYTVKMIYDPDTHHKKLLDIGTYARFGNQNTPIEQIWTVSVATNDGVVLEGFPKFVSPTEAMRIYAQYKNSYSVLYAPVTEPVPLTSVGFVDVAKMQTGSLDYTKLEFCPYLPADFPTFYR
jgi:hypothetical protein